MNQRVQTQFGTEPAVIVPPRAEYQPPRLAQHPNFRSVVGAGISTNTWLPDDLTTGE